MPRSFDKVARSNWGWRIQVKTEWLEVGLVRSMVATTMVSASILETMVQFSWREICLGWNDFFWPADYLFVVN